MENNRKLSQYLKLWIIIVMVIVFSSYPTFAEECNWDTQDALILLNTFITNLWRLFSWIWIILWNIAGVLMTNVMVYWEFMHLDTFLWKIWQMTRSIANYTLWFLFVYSLFKYIFFKDDKPPMEQIKNILVASVLVQASWFLVMVLVDLSTIALATVSSFPAQVLSDNSDLMKTMKGEMVGSKILNDKKVVVINAFSDKYLEWENDSWFIEKWADNSSVDPEKKTIDALMPNANNLWWPFTYLWATAFKGHEYKYREIPKSADCVGAVEKVITNFIFEAWLTVLYSLSLILLIVLLVMRLGYLWVFIAISPIVILLSVVDVVKIKTNDDIFSLKKAIWLIFKPVVFALWISLMFLFVIVLQGIFDKSITSTFPWDVAAQGWSNLSTNRDVIPKVSSSLEDAWIVGVYIKQWAKSMKDIILSFVALVLMWQMVKMALTWSFAGFNENSSIARKMKAIVSKTWDMFWTVWVIPTPEWRMWFNQIWNKGSSPLVDWAVAKLEGRFEERDRSKETILDLLWKWDQVVIKSISEAQKDSFLKSSLVGDAEPKDFVQGLANLRKANKGWFKFQDVRNEINTWIKKFNNLPDNHPSMSTYFGSKDNWSKIRKASEQDNFDIVQWWSISSNEKIWFSAFYEKVLGGDGKYTTYKEFKEKWKEQIYPKKSTT